MFVILDFDSVNSQFNELLIFLNLMSLREELSFGKFENRKVTARNGDFDAEKGSKPMEDDNIDTSNNHEKSNYHKFDKNRDFLASFTPRSLEKQLLMALVRKQTKILIISNRNHTKFSLELLNAAFTLQQTQSELKIISLVEDTLLSKLAVIAKGKLLTAPKLLNALQEGYENPRRNTTTCFCHRREIDLGFTCSTCLAIYCTRLKECLVCKTVF